MSLQALVDRFEKQAPISVMMRATLDNAVSADWLNAMFVEHAEQQSNKELLFSSVAGIMGMVACRIHPSVHAAYQSCREELGVTCKALYDKLQRMEVKLSRQLVRQSALRLGEIVRHTKGARAKLLPGYRVLALDGNHLRRTERRIEELRAVNGAPLPGHALVVLDPELGLFVDVFPCEDGHAQERSLLPQVLETVEPHDVWIDDRNFCTAPFLFGISERKAFFVTREHGVSPRRELEGQRRTIGRCETGMVYEQSVRIFHGDGREQLVRRISVKLDDPTRDGDGYIHILTNLPKKISALKVAALYRKRWSIETAFAEVAQNLDGEIETLGYPKAALFSFCAALLAYNLLSVVMAALRGAHGEEKIDEEVSIYYLADEVAHTHRGLTIALPDDYWTKHYADLTPLQMARELVSIAKTVNLSRYRKHKRGPKKKIKPLSKKGRKHVSTARILAAATS